MKSAEINKRFILLVMFAFVFICAFFILSTKGYFSNVFNAVFYREAIVFMRDNNLWIMDTDGKNQRQLTTFTEKERGVDYFDVSRKGDVIYEASFSPPKGGLIESNIYRLSLKDGGIQKLTNDNKSTCPKISPDGTKVAFVKREIEISRDGLGVKVYSEGIGLVDLESGKEERLVTEGRDTVDLIWCDDKRLVFSEAYGDKAHIVNLEKGESLLTIPVKSRFYARDVYGEKILFSFFETLEKGPLFIYNIRTQEIFPLGRYELGEDTFFPGAVGKFSPDGKKIAYILRGEGSSSLWIIDSDGKNDKKFNLDFRAIITISWSKDGRKIFIGGMDVDSHEMYKDVIGVIDADGSNFKRIADNGSQPKSALIPKITFTPGQVKIIVFIVTSILLIFGIALLLRKVLKIIKIQSRDKIPLRGVFCTQCGKENSPTATFCTNCGQRLK